MDQTITAIEIQFQKVTLEPGEILFVTFKTDSMDGNDLADIGARLRQMFPNNKVVALCVGENDDIKLTSVKDASNMNSCAEPAQYCSNCSCGKKERIEGDVT